MRGKDQSGDSGVLEEILLGVGQAGLMAVNPGFGHRHFLPSDPVEDSGVSGGRLSGLSPSANWRWKAVLTQRLLRWL